MKIEQITENGILITILTADDNKKLFNGEIYCNQAKLAPADNVNNWEEVEEQYEENTEQSDD